MIRTKGRMPSHRLPIADAISESIDAVFEEDYLFSRFYGAEAKPYSVPFGSTEGESKAMLGDVLTPDQKRKLS